MGDNATHLEKMGRELKCPICLSLFNSAVSLSCNHVFCNSCIVKSMKLDATCPVCKVPYHRREIRGAPHMDSLVSIYKNMELASGAHMFVTQNIPSPPEEKHVGDASIENENGKKRQGSSKGRTSKRRGSKKPKETDVDATGPIVMKPSSQTNKRVQLSQIPSCQSLTKSAEYPKDYTDKTVIRLNENPSLSKEESPEPLFWLRDEDDGESLSQPTPSDQLLDVTPVHVPSFSDLKDSDHESPSKAAEQEKPNPGDMFDSEMFEWTQRPCSPEILPGPAKAKALGRGEIDLPQWKLSKDASSNKKGKTGSARNTVVKVGVSKEDYMASSAGESIGEKQDTGGTSSKSTRKVGKLDENVKAKRVTRNKGQTSGVQSGVKISVETEGKQGTKRKRSSVRVSAEQPVAISKELSHGAENVGKSDEAPEKKSSAEKPSLKKRRKSQMGDLSGRSAKKTSEKISKLDSCAIPSRVTQSRGKKIVSDELNQVGDNRQDSTNIKNPNVDKCNHTMQDSEERSTMNKPSLGGNALLRRCDGPLTNKLTCAFCQSSDETEASGKMAHYHRGEPVSADFDGGSKVIHVHENCAKWAPNVYFNKLTAINLDVELTRSRRITCSCCGLKGAALGCYSESCKNSFHVTCAKLIPECRWDDKNFVMLCPLDASSKLPCEETSPKGRKRKRTPKGPLHSQPNQVSEKTDITELQSKPFHGFPKKLVLCCSALTDEEKSVILEFSELSGVTISRKWEPRVSHVIASINENGACKRTLKFMMGILEGKWILSIDWIKACMKNKKYVSEEPYEISIDVHGTRQGPYTGRQRALNKKPKLFNGLKFYIMGDFELAYKGYLQEMIVAAGGTILRRRPISNDENEASTIVVFNIEPSKKKTLTQRRSDAEALARSVNARAASSTWVLDSIAVCQVLDLI